MADSTKTDPAVEAAKNDQELRSQGAPEGSPVTETVENTEGAQALVTNVYGTVKEWPKWMYHRNGDARVFDSAAEFEERAPGEKGDWHPDVNHWKTTGSGLRSPVTGGAGDPAIRAAANPASTSNDDPPARLPVVAHRDEATVNIMGGFRDPQREQAAEDANERVDAATGQTRKGRSTKA